MTKEKKASLTKYLNSMQDKLTSKIPEKHIHSPESYKNFLKNEIRMVKGKLDRELMESTPDKK